MQSDKLKKELSIVGGCKHAQSCQFASRESTLQHDGWAPLGQMTSALISLFADNKAIVFRLITGRRTIPLCLSPSQLPVTVILVPLSLSLTSFLTLHNLWGSPSHRPITLSSGDPVMRGSLQRRYGHRGDHKSAFMERLPTHADAECAIRVHSSSEVKYDVVQCGYVSDVAPKIKVRIRKKTHVSDLWVTSLGQTEAT